MQTQLLTIQGYLAHDGETDIFNKPVIWSHLLLHPSTISQGRRIEQINNGPHHRHCSVCRHGFW